MTTADKIKEILEIELNPTVLIVRDDSKHHTGHHASGDGGHYTITLSAPKLQALNTLEKHKVVYQLLNNLFPDKIHALSIRFLP